MYFQFYFTNAVFWINASHSGKPHVHLNFQTGTELKSGVSCVFHMKRFVELGGSFKMLTMMGFEKFVEAMGIYTYCLKK